MFRHSRFLFCKSILRYVRWFLLSAAMPFSIYLFRWFALGAEIVSMIREGTLPFVDHFFSGPKNSFSSLKCADHVNFISMV